jgi:translation initiation factor 1 (eIF-1/SUI1)
MTEELVNLTDRIKVAVQKNVDLEQKKKELLESLRKAEIDNYKNVLFEELAIYRKLASDLKRKFKCNALYQEDNGGIRLKFYYNDGIEVYIRRVADSRTYSFGLQGEDSELHYMRNMEEDSLRLLSDYLDTEEHALQLLERVRKGYESIFTQFLDYIGKENEELYKAVQELTEKLANSSTIKEEEDGTVEIHLGGKTFRGKIAED